MEDMRARRLRLLHGLCSSDHCVDVRSPGRSSINSRMFEKNLTSILHLGDASPVGCGLICSDALLGQTHHKHLNKMIISFHEKSCVLKAERAWIPRASLKTDATWETEVGEQQVHLHGAVIKEQEDINFSWEGARRAPSSERIGEELIKTLHRAADEEGHQCGAVKGIPSV